jgi:hypothetical protein
MLALGIDAGRDVLTLALVDTAGRAPSLVGSWQEARDPGRERGEQLRLLIDKHCPIRPDAVATALPGTGISHRILRLPFADAARLAATVPFELESLVPFDVESGIISFTVLERESEGATVLAAIAQRADVERHLAEMQAAGIDPAVVDVAALAVAGLARPRGGTGLVVEPRADGGVSLFRGGRLAAFRIVDAAGAEDRLREVRFAALALLDGEEPPPLLVVAPGDEARPLAKALGGETLSLATELPLWCATAPAAHLRAVALAARAAGVATLGLDFRVGDLAYHAPSEEARRQLRIAGVLAASALLLGLISFGAAVVARRAELAGLRAEVSRAVADVLPGAAPGTERTRLQGAIDTLEGRRKVLGGAASGRPRTLELMRGISEAVPAEVAVTIDDFAIDDDGVRLHAKTDSYESVDVVKRALQSVPGLFNPEVKDVKAGVDGRIEFRMALHFASEDRA